MKYLFAKNDPAEIKKAANQIRNFCSKIEERHSIDTSVGECTFFTLVGVICSAIALTSSITWISKAIVCILSAAFIALMAIVLAEHTNWEGLIGHVINKKWSTPEVLHAEEELNELFHKLDSIAFRLQMSKKIENYYKTFGDSIKVNISRCSDEEDREYWYINGNDKNSEQFHVVFSASLHKTVENTVTYSDKFRETFSIKEDTMRRIFKNKGTIDFSWIDSDIEDAKNTFKDLLGQKQPLLESIKEGADLEYYV